MATEVVEGHLRVVALSKKEIVDIIGLLAAQLAGTPLVNNASGAAPSVNIVEHGVIKCRLALVLEPEVK